MQPVYTGRPIVGSHDSNEKFLSVGEPTLWRIGDRDVLLPSDDSRLFVIGVDVGMESSTLLSSGLVLTRPSGKQFSVESLLQADIKRILCFG
jgi:hypothetical protein